MSFELKTEFQQYLVLMNINSSEKSETEMLEIRCAFYAGAGRMHRMYELAWQDPSPTKSKKIIDDFEDQISIFWAEEAMISEGITKIPFVPVPNSEPSDNSGYSNYLDYVVKGQWISPKNRFPDDGTTVRVLVTDPVEEFTAMYQNLLGNHIWESQDYNFSTDRAIIGWRSIDDED